MYVAYVRARVLFEEATTYEHIASTLVRMWREKKKIPNNEQLYFEVEQFFSRLLLLKWDWNLPYKIQPPTKTDKLVYQMNFDYAYELRAHILDFSRPRTNAFLDLDYSILKFRNRKMLIPDLLPLFGNPPSSVANTFPVWRHARTYARSSSNMLFQRRKLNLLCA